MHKIAVPVSGSGSNLKAILEHGLRVSLVLSDRVCPALDIARAANVPVIILERTFGPQFDRDAFTTDLLRHVRRYDINLIAMAGFMTILSDIAFERFPERILNLHPSLLPKFKGAHAVHDALASGEKVTGCTVHIPTAELDAGTILAQQEVPILDDDTAETLHERIKIAERELYPKTIATYLRKIH